MDKFVIRGGNPLLGTIKVSGAKNSALPCMAAAILTEDEVILENIPQVRDIETERKLLESMGAEVELGYGRAQHRTSVKCAVLSDPVAKYEIVKTMRASSLVLGPLIARTGMARVAMPGGCNIGGRPIDLHIKGLESMGATITYDHGYLEARSPNNGNGQLNGAHIVFDKITVTGTEDLLMAAALADGESLFENCAREPEVTDLAAMLNAMGAKIEGAGTGTIKITGVSKLHGARHRINPDRIEAGTFLIAGAISGGDLKVDCLNPEHLGSVIAKLQDCGVKIDVSSDHIRVRSEGAASLKPVDITTEEYPGFPTDMQAQFMALLTQCDGTSSVTENIFENRFMHVQELNRMGANITVNGRTATVKGGSQLQSAAVMCSDLRASAALVLAALVADGESILDRVYHMDRGYERLEEKLRGVGAQIRRMGEVFGKK
jgi:UDP-N-acetylglucosamine 1-carboxyvinyltransferase